MHPVLFQIAGLKIYSFGVMVALAFLLGFALMLVRARKAGENPDDFLEAMIWFIIAGIGGARLFYFIWFPQQFLSDPVGSMLSQGGLVWYGGVIGITLATLLYTRIKKIRLARFGDIFVPSASLGLAIGRIGCLLAGCCYGAPCSVPWAIHYGADHPTHGLAVHPAPLYETFLMLLVTGILIKADQRKPFEGFTTWLFVILAGIVRFFLEYFRGDRLVWIASLNLSASQVVSLIAVLLGAIMLLILSLRHKAAFTTTAPATEPSSLG